MNLVTFDRLSTKLQHEILGHPHRDELICLMHEQLLDYRQSCKAVSSERTQHQAPCSFDAE